MFDVQDCVHGVINAVSSRPAGEILRRDFAPQISRFARNDKYVTEFKNQSTKLDSCVLEDDLTQVLGAIRDTDGLVLACPVYFWDARQTSHVLNEKGMPAAKSVLADQMRIVGLTKCSRLQ